MSENLIQRTMSAYAYPLLIKNLLQAPVIDEPEQEIVYRDRLRLTYAAFRRRVCRLAGALTRIGVKAGDTVAVMDWDSHRYLECFYAVPMLGAVLHTVNIRLSPEQILYTIDHADDDWILVNEEFLPLIEQIRGRIDKAKGYVLLQDEPRPPQNTVSFLGEFEALLAGAEDHFDFPDFDENTRATTFYTTGTTGLPKGVYFSHRQLVLHTLAVMAVLGTPASQGRFHQRDVYMPLTPMFHVHAWGLPYVATSLGVKQVYPGKYAPESLLRLIEREGVTLSHCVPTILHLLLNHPVCDSVDLSGWKVLIGGAALPQALCRAALAKGIDVFAGYGLSETCPVLTVAHVGTEELSAEEELAVRCKTGRTLPLVDLRVVDEELREVARDDRSVGEIVVRAPWLTQGYLKEPRSSEALWRGGWLHTGDVAHRDGRGYVKITDRMKDVIKIGGEWLSSLELEDLLNIHPAVAETAVIGLPDNKWGERPLALVVKKGESVVSEKELLHHLHGFVDKGMIAKEAVLLKVLFVSALDKTSVGKINKRGLREKYQED